MGISQLLPGPGLSPDRCTRNTPNIHGSPCEIKEEPSVLRSVCEKEPRSGSKHYLNLLPMKNNKSPLVEVLIFSGASRHKKQPEVPHLTI